MQNDSYLGDCPLCDRPMVKGSSTMKHHFIPKSKGGKETTVVHRVCEVKLHSLFTNKELKENYNTPEKCREHPEFKKFIKWVSKKPADFYDRSKRANRVKNKGKYA